MKNKQFGILSGALIFVLMIVLMIFVAAPVQQRWGMAGLAATELMLLLLALLACAVKGVNPIKLGGFHRLRGMEFLASLLTYGGFYFLTAVSSLFMQLVFPQTALRSTEISGVIMSVSLPMAVLIAALLPAVCEEFLHRGVYLSSLSRLKKTWQTVLVMGLLFGVFHLDPYRFLPTAVLGMGLTYVMLRTKNILYPMLLHFCNNLLSVAASFYLADIQLQAPAVPFWDFLGYAMTYGGFAVLCLYFGTACFAKLDGEQRLREASAAPVDIRQVYELRMSFDAANRKKQRIAVVSGLSLIAAGFVLRLIYSLASLSNLLN